MTYYNMLKTSKKHRRRFICVLIVLSVFVASFVGWKLKITGITMTDDVYCGMEEHSHTAECYETNENGESVLVCKRTEHTHSLACYSNIEADVETKEIWEGTLPERNSTECKENLIDIADSQIGYTESTLNYALAEDGTTKRGYTRYGEWYGNPYADWSSMFASFCLHYAGYGKEEFPYSAGAYAWCAQLTELGIYKDKADYSPVPGDIVFFCDTLDGRATRAGIVTVAEDDKLTVIQGNSNNSVEYLTCFISDAAVAGFACVPEKQCELPHAAVPGENETTSSPVLNLPPVVFTPPKVQSVPTDSAVPADSIDLKNKVISIKVLVDGTAIPVNSNPPVSVNENQVCQLLFQFNIGIAEKTGGYYKYCYQIPSSVMSRINLTPTSDIPFYGKIINAQGDEVTVLMGHYTVTGNGLITYNFDETFATSYVNINIDDFRLGYTWKDDTGSNPISLIFNDDCKYNINILRNSNLLVNKYITRDTADKRTGHCRVDIQCFGDTRSVSVRDILSGNYTYTNADNVAGSVPVLELRAGEKIRFRIEQYDGTYRSLTGRTDIDPNDSTVAVYTVTAEDAKTGTLSGLPEFDLINGDTLTVLYDIHVTNNAAFLADAFAGTVTGKNTAYATIAGEDENYPASATFSYAGSNSHLIEKNSAISADNTSIEWTIDINKSPIYSMNGLTVYDYLGQYMTYDTAHPLIIKTYDPNGKLAETKNLNLADYVAADGRSWSYTINDTGVHSYKFTYTTTIDSDYNGQVNLENGTNGRLLDVWLKQPTGNKPGGIHSQAGRKDYGYTKGVNNPSIDDKFINWNTTFTVNSGSMGPKYFMLVDLLPTFQNHSGVTDVVKLVTKNGSVVDLTGKNTYTASTICDIEVYELNNGTLDYDSNGNITNKRITLPGFNDGVTPLLIGAENSSTLVNGYPAGFRITKTGYRPASPQTDKTLEAAGYNLPGGFGKYADGYTIVIKYRTTSETDNANEGTMLMNNAKYYFGATDNRGNVDAYATAILPIEQEHVAVTVDKTATSVADDKDRIHYEVKVNDGMFTDIPDGTMTWVDTYDELMEPTGYLYFKFANSYTSFISTTQSVCKTNIGSNIINVNNNPVIRFSGFVESPAGSNIFIYQFTRYTHCGAVPDSPKEPCKVTITLNKNNHTITYFFDRIPTDTANCRQQQWMLEYDMVISGAADVAYGKFTVNNRFQFFGDDITDELGYAVTETTMERKQVDKTCVELNNEFRFTVKISYNDIVGAMSDMTVVDTMNEYLDLTFSSVEALYEYADGKTADIRDLGSVATKNYSSSSGVLTVVIDAGKGNATFADVTEPDEPRYIVLNYTCTIVGAMIGEKVTISNTVDIDGLQYGSDTYEKLIEVPFVNAVGSGTALLFDILKVDGNVEIGSPSVLLEGAQFKLYNISDRNNPVLVATRTTNNNGMCLFASSDIVTEGNGMSLSTLVPYELVESEAPLGYVRDFEGAKFFIYSNSDLTNGRLVLTPAQQELLDNCTPYYISSEIPIHFNLVNLKTSYFYINKTDSVTGNTVDYGAAEFTLYSDAECTQAVETATTQSGIAVFTRLTAGTYYLKETVSPPGYSVHSGVYTVVIGSPDVSGIVSITVIGTDVNGAAVNSSINSGGTIAFPDKSGFVMPATGGAGTAVFFAAGIFLTVFSLVLFVISLIKRKPTCTAGND